MKLSFDTAKGIALLAGVAAVGYVAWRAYKKGSEIAPAVIASVNPADPQNIVNRGVSAVGQAVTGDNSWTLGGWLAETFDPTTRRANAELESSRHYVQGTPSPGWQAIVNGGGGPAGATSPASTADYPEPATVRDATRAYVPTIGQEALYLPVGSMDYISADNPTAVVNTSPFQVGA